MAGRIPLSFAAILLLAAPAAAGAAVVQVAGPAVGQSQGPGNDVPQAPGQDQNGQGGISDAQSFALVAGQILGAASACEQINEDRVSDATKKAVKITTDSAESPEDVEAAQQYMLDSADSAQDAVKNGDADCNRVSASFSRLEQIEQGSDQQSQLEGQNGSPGDQDNQDGQDDQDDAE